MGFAEKLKSISTKLIDRNQQHDKAPFSASELKSCDTKSAEPEIIALKAVSGEMVEAECMRIIPMLCQKAEESPNLRPEISKLIDVFFELEIEGNDAMLLEALKKAESRYRA